MDSGLEIWISDDEVASSFSSLSNSLLLLYSSPFFFFFFTIYYQVNNIPVASQREPFPSSLWKGRPTTTAVFLKCKTTQFCATARVLRRIVRPLRDERTVMMHASTLHTPTWSNIPAVSPALLSLSPPSPPSVLLFLLIPSA